MFTNLSNNLSQKVILIIGIIELPRHMMHHCLSSCIRFIRKSFTAESVSLHLISVERLYFLYHPIHLCINVWLGLTVTREKIDNPHDRLRLCQYITDVHSCCLQCGDMRVDGGVPQWVVS